MLISFSYNLYRIVDVFKFKMLKIEIMISFNRIGIIAIYISYCNSSGIGSGIDSGIDNGSCNGKEI